MKMKIMSCVFVVILLVSFLPQKTVLATDLQDITFDDAIVAYDEIMEKFWKSIEEFYGTEEGEPGSLGNYWEARDSFADNVEEMYQVAVEGRETCIEMYEIIVEARGTALEFYNLLNDTEKAEMTEWKYYFDEGFNDATNVINELEEVPPIAGDFENIYINDKGYLDGNPIAPAYWKVNEDGLLTIATKEDYSLKIEIKEGYVDIHMKNFVFTSAPEWVTDAFWAEYPVVLELEGENIIVAERGNAFGIVGDLVVNGEGSLKLTATKEEIITDNGESFMPIALLVEGKFENHATIICDSKNPDNSVFIGCEVKDIINTGELIVGEEQKIATYDVVCDSFNAPQKYENSSEYPVPTDHEYVAKAYYYTPDVFYPNNIYHHEDDTEQWTVYGKYDESGNPIGSNVWYQYWYVDERGVILTEDLKNPCQYLVYEDNPEELIKDKDIVSISDGKEHVFNADLYALWFTDGDVTVNGNVIQDLACFNVADRVPSESGEYFNYVFDKDGNRLWITESNDKSKVVVKGNVGLLSLNDSFEGDVTVKGNVELVGFYEDLHPSVTSTLDWVPEKFYGSNTNSGKVINNGEFVGIPKKVLEGYCGYSVYDTEYFYAKTERELNGEVVHGTTAAIKDSELLVDVSKDIVGDDTWPCVKEVDDKENAKIKDKLTNKDSKLIVMDICLIQNNKKKVEPDATVNLYFDNLDGFEKPAVYHVKENGEIEKIYVYDGEGEFDGNITCQTDSFSTYFIAEDQELDDETVGPVPDLGDTNGVVYSIVLILLSAMVFVISNDRNRVKNMQ